MVDTAGADWTPFTLPRVTEWGYHSSVRTHGMGNKKQRTDNQERDEKGTFCRRCLGVQAIDGDVEGVGTYVLSSLTPIFAFVAWKDRVWMELIEVVVVVLSDGRCVVVVGGRPAKWKWRRT